MLFFEKLDFQVFGPFSVLGGFAGSGTVTGGFFGKFQYRTPRFRGVSCPPCPENLVRKIFCSTFGEFQGAVFPVPKIIVVLYIKLPANEYLLFQFFGQNRYSSAQFGGLSIRKYD